MTIKGIDISGILNALVPILLTVVGGFFTWVQNKLATANAEKNAWARLGAIGLAMAGDLWDSLTVTYQQDMVDGKLDRDLYVKILQDKLDKYTSKEELQKLAEALKLPVPGILAWLAEFIIDRILAAHNPANPSVSPAAFKVTDEGDAAIQAKMDSYLSNG